VRAQLRPRCKAMSLGEQGPDARTTSSKGKAGLLPLQSLRGGAIRTDSWGRRQGGEGVQLYWVRVTDPMACRRAKLIEGWVAHLSSSLMDEDQEAALQ